MIFPDTVVTSTRSESAGLRWNSRDRNGALFILTLLIVFGSAVRRGPKVRRPGPARSAKGWGGRRRFSPLRTPDALSFAMIPAEPSSSRPSHATHNARALRHFQVVAVAVLAIATGGWVMVVALLLLLVVVLSERSRPRPRMGLY